jgi:hypothetical protein
MEQARNQNCSQYTFARNAQPAHQLDPLQSASPPSADRLWATGRSSKCEYYYSSLLSVLLPPIAGSKSVVSLCATKPLSKKRGAISYRFGRIGSIELEFPTKKVGSLDQFRYAHYSRHQTERTEVSFSNGEYVYTVLDYFEGDSQRGLQGVKVTKQDSTGSAEAHLQTLERLIPCNNDNALANCLEPSQDTPSK